MYWITYFFLVLSMLSGSVNAMVAGGRPNAISGGHNAFAGVVNPANAVWIEDRFDVGLFLVQQKFVVNNKNNKPIFNDGKTNLTYGAEHLITGDAAIHKKGNIQGNECSISFATYTTPGYLKLHTKKPIPILGKTPIFLKNKTQVFSTIFSLKLSKNHSLGLSLDWFYLSHQRNGYQNSDNPLRSVSPGNVTNNGTDHSHGLGLTFGWRWNISKSLAFGLAFIKKSYVGQYKKYQGYEPRRAKNYIPEALGGGFTYKFNERIAGRLEVVWTNSGNLPNSNNSVYPNGKLNRHKRGSNKSPSTGLQDATLINCGLGYKVNKMLSLGLGFSHRINLKRKSRYIISRSYTLQTIYNLFTLGINFNYCRNDFFLTFSHGLESSHSGYMPEAIGGGKFSYKKNYSSLSIAWGYLY